MFYEHEETVDKIGYLEIMGSKRPSCYLHTTAYLFVVLRQCREWCLRLFEVRAHNS